MFYEKKFKLKENLLWKAQGVLAILLLLITSIICCMLSYAFYLPSNKLFIFYNLLLPQLPGILILILIGIGSFYYLKIALYLNLLYFIVSIHLIVISFTVSTSNVSAKYLTLLSTTADFFSIILGVVGLIILYQKYQLKIMYYRW